MWKSGFGLICGFSGCASCRAGNANVETISGWSLCAISATGSAAGPQIPFAQMSERIFLFPLVGETTSCSGFFGVLRPSRLCDLRIMALIYGRRLELAGPRYGNRLADGRMATYVTLYIRIHNYLRS